MFTLSKLLQFPSSGNFSWSRVDSYPTADDAAMAADALELASYKVRDRDGTVVKYRGEPMYRVEVIADSSGKFCGNAMAYTTQEEAVNAAKSLAWRWTLVSEWRVLRDSPEGTTVVAQGALR